MLRGIVSKFSIEFYVRVASLSSIVQNMPKNRAKLFRISPGEMIVKWIISILLELV